MLPKPLAAIQANAIRLLEDARLLFTNGRHASSVALSILAIEEVGKFLVLSAAKPGEARNMLRHHEKQTAASQMYSGDLWLSLSGDMVKGNEELFNRRLAELRAMPIEQVFAGPPTPPTEASERIAKIFEEAIRRRSEGLLQARYMLETGMGNTLKMKNVAFYVDVADNDTIMSDPESITEAQALEWLQQADRAVVTIGYEQ